MIAGLMLNERLMLPDRLLLSKELVLCFDLVVRMRIALSEDPMVGHSSMHSVGSYLMRGSCSSKGS